MCGMKGEEEGRRWKRSIKKEVKERGLKRRGEHKAERGEDAKDIRMRRMTVSFGRI